MPGPSRSTAAEWFRRPTASSVSTIWRDPEQVLFQSPPFIASLVFLHVNKVCRSYHIRGSTTSCLSARLHIGRSQVPAVPVPKTAWHTSPLQSCLLLQRHGDQNPAKGLMVSWISGLELWGSELDVRSYSPASLSSAWHRGVSAVNLRTHTNVLCLKMTLLRALDLVRQLQTTTSQLI